MSIKLVEKLKTLCEHFFSANCLFPNVITFTLRRVGHVISYHTSKLHLRLGHELGLNSMQGRESKHVKLA